ncbi:glycoside hydrolase family 15 protein [Streptomyces muensis]|uniref:Trehalase n=1 Tax=Streptomyces muensis TaxID=1077944 RepID=A0A9X1PRQ4_STRM4|nr:glycoside hydrolase family 15 protein [Streptomyces muensis]MCF1592297.1 glycoside hydrolase family 15 protein [Streptomyces muensis]
MSRRIEDFGLVSDMQTAALIGRDGSVEWACLPRFDSPAVFARLLGTEDNGFWRISPAGTTAPAVADRRQYRGESLVLESQWVTADGIVNVVDFMPPRDSGAPQLVRVVEGVSGRVHMSSRLRIRMEYGSVVPWVVTRGGRTQAVAGPHALWLDGDVPTYGQDLTTCADFTVSAGQRVAFVLSWQHSHAEAPAVPDAEKALEETEKYWADWASRCSYTGPYREAVVRSLITLKALTYAPTGAIVAAPTTSLPEEIGGVRNWDYRYCWLRDAAITLSSLLRTGYHEEARAWSAWLVRAVAGDPENLQIMYGIAGERQLPESELDWLPGYEGSRPVRIGNGAAGQLQLDVYGEVAETLHRARQAGLPAETGARLQARLITFLERHWHEPDEGIWEVRGPRRHFVHSKVMAWVAVDRTIQLIESGVIDGPLERWRVLRDDIHRDVCTKGYDPERNTFTQSYGSSELDAALLLIPHMGFLPPSDPRVIGTIEAIQRELLTPDGFVLRYPTSSDADIDGLPGDEGAFLACSFWLAEDLAMIGRADEARELFERLLALRNDLGLLAEEWDPVARRLVGNFPQAFSHVALLDTALRLGTTAAATGQA